uniref:Uncharacterized protein n=1 Tax=Peronospora matthiolae TaxID=2874970 RepID=A0AAV1TM30_9STRA
MNVIARTPVAASLAPAGMPAELFKMPSRIFVAEVLDQRRPNVVMFWLAAQVEEIGSDHRSLLCRE